MHGLHAHTSGGGYHRQHIRHPDYQTCCVVAGLEITTNELRHPEGLHVYISPAPLRGHTPPECHHADTYTFLPSTRRNPDLQQCKSSRPDVSSAITYTQRSSTRGRHGTVLIQSSYIQTTACQQCMMSPPVRHATKGWRGRRKGRRRHHHSTARNARTSAEGHRTTTTSSTLASDGNSPVPQASATAVAVANAIALKLSVRCVTLASAVHSAVLSPAVAEVSKKTWQNVSFVTARPSTCTSTTTV